MYTNEVCAYETELPDGRKPKILWRCSVRLPDWRAPSVDSIDFSTMILGYATNFLLVHTHLLIIFHFLCTNLVDF